MATKKTNIRPTLIDWFCRNCWRSGVVQVGLGSLALKSPATYAWDDHKTVAPPLTAISCSPDSITSRVRPPVVKKPKYPPPKAATP